MEWQTSEMGRLEPTDAIFGYSDRSARAAPETRFPLHIVLGEDGRSSEVGPSIVDPFDAGANLGACMTFYSLQHMRKEFRRAHELCCGGASLTDLLQPWSPEPGVVGESPED